MKKLTLAFTALLLSALSFGQSIQDNATIPVSVTLNSILRLTVTSGGNIQFVFNTMEQYTNGILPSNATTTKFTVSSSKDFDVYLGAEDAALLGVEDAVAHQLDLAVIGHTVSGTGTGTLSGGPNNLTQIDADPTLTYKIVDTGTPGVGNLYEIAWEAGTPTQTSVLNEPADVYITNVLLNVIPQP